MQNQSQQFPAEYPNDEEYERWKVANGLDNGGRNNYPVLPSESRRAYVENESMRRALKDEV